VLEHAVVRSGNAAYADVAKVIRTATLKTAADGIRTFDLGGDATTSGVVDEVVARVATGIAALG
jgi:isocitrate/isopropylmalate dehydrogenase